MDSLSKIEQLKSLLPQVYKDFYTRCSKSIPKNLIGIDLLNHTSELNRWAEELLTENGIENFLENNDLVFMMHQGYMFWYFKADENPDPVVYGYHEEKMKPEKLGNFSTFIKEYIG